MSAPWRLLHATMLDYMEIDTETDTLELYGSSLRYI